MNGVLDKRKSSPLHKNDDETTRIPESEEHLLKKKVQIKSQALMMLSQELDQCRMQRDRYKLLAEQLQEDLDRRKQTESKKIVNGYRNPVGSLIQARNQGKTKADTLEEDTKLMDLLIEAQEKNKCLRLQVDTLRQKLKEAQDDIKALRSSKSRDFKPSVEATPALHQREELIEQLEKLHVKCKQLRLDLQSVLDEKQELEMERDAFKCKAHRLNYELSKALNAPKAVDVDALITENRYLQERLQQLLEEKELAQHSVQKYKSMLDSKRQKGTITLGGKSSVGSVMTFKQVEQLLKQGPNIPAQKSADALSELHSICTALLEALNDKNLALAHQKKTNKILAARMCELDKVIQSPTSKLLDGYSSADVDIKCDSTSMTSDLSEERSDGKESSDLPGDLSEERSDGKESTELPVEECSAEQDVACKKSEENSIEQTVEAKESDKCCTAKDDFKKKLDISIEEENKSYFKPIEYESLDVSSEDVTYKNVEESLRESLPEHLMLLVQKHLNELRADLIEKP